MTGVLCLTLLSPGIVEAIWDAKHGPEVTLALVLKPFSEVWRMQACCNAAHRT
jgi:hypothetical protein